MTNLSNPNAIPPCGGVPYLSASIKNPNFSEISSSDRFIILNISFCNVWSWILIEPPATSYPLITIS